MSDALELNFQVFGEGDTPLVMCHGLYGSSSNWRSVARSLSPDFRLFCPDARNHGDSPHSELMDYPSMAEDLAAFIDENCGGRAHVLGHSMGGKTAMQLALTRPEKIDRLIVVDIAPVAYDHSHRPMIEAMMNLKLEGLKNRAEADRNLTAEIAEPMVRLFLLQNLMRRDDHFAWRMNLPVLHASTDDIVGFPENGDSEFDHPTLFLYGEDSDYVTEESRSMIPSSFTAAEFFGIPGAGHWVHADKPDVLIREIQRFLD